ncbi:GR25 family glycosyltransferase involved in LPS biosynthesis [Chryseobacterium sp. SLBN-27]|uniref:hypothetical protein n=1 Tax=Chryseobacterium sp. SLBN-27 TaxID=3042287 RepID=UPI0028546629|nr:hypothetical protein [Chryseobacterium sp. SLBN-27]MDR6159295.1 GR25 family glycosyltransferase involved in LPS biosynthesis [Chryseobacterium sp. SLBN-27]
MMKDFEDIIIPTYIINLKTRKDRLESIQKEFEGRKEFDVQIIEACEHRKGNIGLWKSILNIIRSAQSNDDDVILIVEDDHVFTNSYNKNIFISNIIDAHNQGADILLGGIGGGSKYVVPITENRFWVDHFWCTQFVIVYKKFFQEILDVDFGDEDGADNVLSKLTLNKMVLYPFISVQKNFGYSDVPNINNNEDDIETFFKKAEKELLFYHKKYIEFIK